MSSKEAVAMEKEYEGFLQELEGDKDMRAAINLYKKQDVKAAAAAGGEGGMEEESDGDDDNEDDVKLDELLSDLTIERDTAGETDDREVSVLTADQAALTQPKVSLEEGSDTVFDAAHYDPKDFKF